MSHTYGTRCPDCLITVITSGPCPEACPDPHGYVWSTWPEHGCSAPGENRAQLPATPPQKPVFAPPPNEGPYSFSEIEKAIRNTFGSDGSPDSWNIPVIYEDHLVEGVLKRLRGLS